MWIFCDGISFISRSASLVRVILLKICVVTVRYFNSQSLSVSPTWPSPHRETILIWAKIGRRIYRRQSCKSSWLAPSTIDWVVSQDDRVNTSDLGYISMLLQPVKLYREVLINICHWCISSTVSYCECSIKI